MSGPTDSQSGSLAAGESEIDSTVPDRLARRLAASLPGKPAQRQFAPELSYGRHHGPPPHDARQAAVLVLLTPHDNQWTVPLTLRPTHMKVHAGQVSFPGGLIDCDESPEQCSLRELAEELGVATAGVRLLGRLSPLYVYASNFYVTPCVATVVMPLEFVASEAEVAAVLELPLDVLTDPRHHGSHEVRRGGLRFRAPHIEFAGHFIWGATSMILSELIQILAELNEG